MAVNNLTWEQSIDVLNAVVAQATGTQTLTATDTSDFVSVAQTALKTGYDTVLGALSQVLSRTIFSIRPYTRKFAGLEADSVRYGAIVRKVTALDSDLVEDARYNPTDGDSPDMYKIRKPKVIQTNFYGATPFQDCVTIFREQLEQAFSSPSEFGSFVSLVMGNMSDKLEQARESMARATMVNAMAGKIAMNADVIHLLTEYNTATGLTLSADDVYKPDNFATFMRWVYSRIADLSDKMSQRSSLFHASIGSNTIMRHTPVDMQKIYISASAKYQIDAQVLSTTYNDQYLKRADFEPVSYWQSIKSPNSISATPSYLNTADGTVKKATDQINNNNVFGLMFDRDAIGYTVINQYMEPTRINPKGSYYNIWYNETYRWWNDFTENIIVLSLD